MTKVKKYAKWQKKQILKSSSNLEARLKAEVLTIVNLRVFDIKAAYELATYHKHGYGIEAIVELQRQHFSDRSEITIYLNELVKSREALGLPAPEVDLSSLPDIAFTKKLKKSRK